MKKNLMIVESPAKAKTIEKFLGKEYKVIASVGHLRDLPKSQMGVDLENNFEPKYVTIRGKGDIAKQLRTEAKKADNIFLATDPDREGEAISWHIQHLLGIEEDEKVRVEFNEITADIIKKAVESPRKINLDLVDAQQARRVLDRIVGYSISPLLWSKVSRGLSAGRVQSVALKMICEREEEIRNFVPVEYWTITAVLTDGSSEFEAELTGKQVGEKEEKISISNEKEALEIVNSLNPEKYTVKDVKKGKKKRNPYPAFITSTLQQEASKKLGFSSKKTMHVAQNLYEGVTVAKGEHIGLITYMRTDSVRLSAEAVKAATGFIVDNYGKEFSNGGNSYAGKKKDAQDAHEAIRPTSVFRTPDSVKAYLTPDQYKLYTLIWKRFVASQMSPAVFDTISATIFNNDYIFKINNSRISFKGYLIIYDYDEEEKMQYNASSLKKSDVLKQSEILPKQRFTKPQPRYTEASLIKKLEELGIGRPSTFAQIVGILIERSYVSIEQKSFYATELGEKINGILQDYFGNIIGESFTAKMEDKLDEISEGQLKWKEVIAEFYQNFEKSLEKANEEIEKEKEIVVESDEVCEKCGRKMVFKKGRYGEFLACPGYPECKNTKAIVKAIGVKCPKCGGDVVEKNTKGGKVFYGCSNYPNCDFVSWDEPSGEPCPECGSPMIIKRRRRGDFAQCINEECKKKIHL